MTYGMECTMTGVCVCRTAGVVRALLHRRAALRRHAIAAVHFPVPGTSSLFLSLPQRQAHTARGPTRLNIHFVHRRN